MPDSFSGAPSRDGNVLGEHPGSPLAEDDSYAFAIEAAGIGTWCWHLSTGRIAWSGRCRELFGFGEGVLDYPTFLALVDPSDRPLVEEAVQKSLRGAGLYDVEYRIRVHDGKAGRWVAAKGRIEHDRAGTPERMLGVVQDITARRSAEMQRDEYRRRLLKVQEEERLRLSRDLHDQAGQELARALLDIQALKTYVGEAGHDALDRLRNQVAAVGDCLRRVAVELRPSALDDLGLRHALDDLLSGWSGCLGIPVDLACRGKLDDLPDEVTIAFYRIAQEGMTNIMKHAKGATVVEVALLREADTVSLRIADDGPGIDPAMLAPSAAAAPALGIVGMRERLALIGGELAFEAPRQGGTVLLARIQLSAFGRIGDGQDGEQASDRPG